MPSGGVHTIKVALRGKQVLQLGVAPGLQQARQADGRPGHIREPLLVGPGAAQHGQQPVRIGLDQVGIPGDLAPSLFHRRQVLHAVLLDRVEQALEPLGADGVVRSSFDQNRDELLQGAGDGRPEGARRGVDVLEGWPDALHQRYRTLARRDGVGLRYGLDFRHRLLEPGHGERRATPAIGVGAQLRPEAPSVLCCHALLHSLLKAAEAAQSAPRLILTSSQIDDATLGPRPAPRLLYGHPHRGGASVCSVRIS